MSILITPLTPHTQFTQSYHFDIVEFKICEFCSLNCPKQQKLWKVNWTEQFNKIQNKFKSILIWFWTNTKQTKNESILCIPRQYNDLLNL